jgi:tRNA(His) guanylyltransferase
MRHTDRLGLRRQLKCQGTDSKAKNEMLFSQFNINYNNLSPMFRKGSVLVRSDPNEVIEDIDNSEPLQADLEAIQPEPTKSSPDKTESSMPDDQKPFDDLGGRPRREKRPKRIRPYEGLTGAVEVLHEDIIGDRFWKERIWLLA